MLKGLFQAAAGMKTRLEVQDIVANNLANAGTAGFQREIASIHSRPLPPAPAPGRPGIASGAATSTPVEYAATRSTPDLRPGTLQPTGSGTDVALDGPGYLVVQTAGGPRLTRGGTLHVDLEGRLATQAGHPLLDTGGVPIRVGDRRWEIARDGAVIVDEKPVGRLRLVLPAAAPRREGNTLFDAGDAKDAPAGSVRVLQGYREHSNVDAVREMVDMIAGVRAYESSQRAVLAQDQTLQSLLELLRR
jgi:flagellar basal-body rod protein FlgG